MDEVDETDTEPIIVPFSDAEKRQIAIQAEAAYQATKRLQQEQEVRQRVAVPEPLPPEETLYDYRLHWVAVFPAAATLWVLPIIVVFLLLIGWFAQSEVRNIDPNFGLAQYLFPVIPLVASVLGIGIVIKNNWRVILREIVLFRNARIIVTNRRILYIVDVKGWVLNFISRVTDINTTLYRETINNPDVEQSGIGELFGYGTLKLLSQADHDKRFTNLRYVRHPEMLKTILDVQKPEPRRKKRK